MQSSSKGLISLTLKQSNPPARHELDTRMIQTVNMRHVIDERLCLTPPQ